MSADGGIVRGRQRRARLVLVGLFALFFVPILGALTLVIVAPGWLPFGQVNHGELVQPPQAAGLDGVEPLDDGAPPGGDPEAVWTLVLVSDGSCPSACLEGLVVMRQARLALGKDAGRVARWWLVTAAPDARTVAAVRRDHPGLRVGRIDRGGPLARSGAGAVQLVDPAGLLILRFPEDPDASELLEDLKRLLKISKQG